MRNSEMNLEEVVPVIIDVGAVEAIELAVCRSMALG